MRDHQYLDRAPTDLLFRFLSFDAARADQWMSWLTREEKACLNDFGHPKRRHEFITGRAALRMLLADHLGTAPASILLQTAADGAVEAPDTELCVSLAHSDDHAVAVAAGHSIGVDLERIQPRRTDLHEFLLHPEEYGVLHELPLGRDHIHVLCWTLKEATLKGLRTGFRLSPKKLRLDIDLDTGTALIKTIDGQRWQLQFQECQLGDGEASYYWSVAVPAEKEQSPPQKGRNTLPR